MSAVAPARSRRATAAEVALRTEAVARAILMGHSHYDLCRYAAENWNLSTRQAERYIQKAREELKAAAKQRTDDLYAEHLAARREGRRLAFKQGDLRTALAFLRDEAELLHLYQQGSKDTFEALHQLVEAVKEAREARHRNVDHIESSVPPN